MRDAMHLAGAGTEAEEEGVNGHVSTLRQTATMISNSIRKASALRMGLQKSNSSSSSVNGPMMITSAMYSASVSMTNR